MGADPHLRTFFEGSVIASAAAEPEGASEPVEPTESVEPIESENLSDSDVVRGPRRQAARRARKRIREESYEPSDSGEDGEQAFEAWLEKGGEVGVKREEEEEGPSISLRDDVLGDIADLRQEESATAQDLEFVDDSSVFEPSLSSEEEFQEEI